METKGGESSLKDDLDMLQHTNVFVVARGPKLNTELQV